MKTLALALATSCAPESQLAPPAALDLVVESDPGVRLAGVSVFLDGEPVGQTDEKGRLSAPLRRSSGDLVRVEHVCPAGHRADAPSKLLRHRPFDHASPSGPSALEITVRCIPLQRRAAFVIRATRGPLLPVSLNGQPVATTNDSGVAHFSTQARPGTDFTVTIDTDADKRLRPRNPVHLRTLADSDEIFVINQSFDYATVRRKNRSSRPRLTKIE